MCWGCTNKVAAPEPLGGGSFTGQSLDAGQDEFADVGAEPEPHFPACVSVLCNTTAMVRVVDCWFDAAQTKALPRLLP